MAKETRSITYKLDDIHCVAISKRMKFAEINNKIMIKNITGHTEERRSK